MSKDDGHISPAAEKAIRAAQRRNRFLQRRDVLLSICTPIVFLILWEITAKTGMIDERIFSSPTNIVETGYTMVLDGSLAAHTWATVYRLILGFALGHV